MAGKNNEAGSQAAELDEPVLTKERLEYMADLLLELQTLAAGAGCETLSGLLHLSHAEARRKADTLTS